MTDNQNQEMTTIEKIKHRGAVTALQESIDSLLFELTNRNWDAIKQDSHYCRLGDAIDDAETILQQMRERLVALQEMESENK